MTSPACGAAPGAAGIIAPLSGGRKAPQKTGGEGRMASAIDDASALGLVVRRPHGVGRYVGVVNSLRESVRR
jgi:hypothetical protein